MYKYINKNELLHKNTITVTYIGYIYIFFSIRIIYSQLKHLHINTFTDDQLNILKYETDGSFKHDELEIKFNMIWINIVQHLSEVS